MLKQQRGNAPVMHGVRDRERDLRRPAAARPAGAVPCHLEAGEPDDLAVEDGEQGGVVGARLPGAPPIPHAATMMTSAQSNAVPRKPASMPSAKWRTGRIRAIHRIHDGVSFP